MVDLGQGYPFGLAGRRWALPVLLAVAVFVDLLIYDHRYSVLATAQSPATLAVFNFITRWGESDWILIPSALLLALSAGAFFFMRSSPSRPAFLELVWLFGFIFVGVGLPSLVSNLTKRIIGRGRPDVFAQFGTLSFHPFAGNFDFESFPSGHTTTAFAAAMVLGFLAPRWFWVGLVYAIAVAASRLVLGAHYPTDVFGGALLGSLGAYWVRNFFARRGWGFERLPAGDVMRLPMPAMRRALRLGRA
ncbi:MAG TPA: phosphatase PAP2 family protein [Devosia sp.]|nr:phosphatase PAP2 family protein [Devosia sp.]